MTDSELEIQRSRIEVVKNKWFPLLLHSDWRIDVIVEPNSVHCRGIGLNGQDGGMATALQAEYYRATIYVDACNMQSAPDTWVEESFIHEVCHALTEEMSPNHAHGSIPEEHVATALARAFQRVYLDGYGAGLSESKGLIHNA